MRITRILILMIAIARYSFAATYNVTSISELNTRIGAAVAGDTIIVKNGTYTASASIGVSKVGTAALPITIKAETVGGVTINGSAGFKMNSPAAYIVIEGFIFNHAGGISIPTGTSHIRFTRNVVELSIPSGSDVSYFNISGNDAEIDHNELRNKSTLGEMLDITGSGSQVARRLWVHHNYFHDFTSPGGNGAETIRWGLSGLSLSTGDGLCEFNLFVRCEGENEMISNKSSGNTYRYNTVLDCDGGEISQRHGDNNRYYANFVKNSSGIRIYGDRNQIYCNYVEGCDKGINIGNGDGEVETGDPLTSHDKPDDTVIVYNTLVNNSTQYTMNGRTGGLGAVGTVFANNIIQGGSTAVSISGTAPYSNPTWAGNIIWISTNIGNIPAGGYTNVNPLLVKDASGEYHIQTGSPAINAGTGSYPLVTVDMDGQARDAQPDKGADEFSSAPVIAHILTPSEVGPNAAEGNFTFGAAPASRSVTAGQPTSFDLTVTGKSGFTDAVNFTVTGFPTGVTAAFTPTSVPGTGTAAMNLTTANTTFNGTYNLTITAASGAEIHTAPVQLTITGSLSPFFEMELLTLNAESPTGVSHTSNDANFSGGQSRMADSTAAGQYMEMLLPAVQAGVYEVFIGIKTLGTRGIVQLSAGDVSGSLVNVGTPRDEYASSATYIEQDLGSWQTATTGNKLFRFTITGKNPASTNYSMNIDYIKLMPKQSAASDWLLLQ